MNRLPALLLLLVLAGCRRFATAPLAPTPTPTPLTLAVPAPTPSPTAAPTVRPLQRVGGDVSEPIEVSRVPFRVPPELQRKSADWTVILAAVIEADGRVTGAHTLRPVARGSEPCIAHIASQLEQWRYKPATKAGKPVPVELVITSLHCPCCRRP